MKSNIKYTKEKIYSNETKIILYMSCLLLLVIGITYIFLHYVDFENKSTKLDSSTISLNYVENNIVSIQNSLPISDSVAKNLDKDASGGNTIGYFDFNVSCNIVGKKPVAYEIYALKDTAVESLSDDYVKIYLTNGEKEIAYSNYGERTVPVYRDLKVSSSNPAGKRLYAGEFTSNGVHTFRLRMWLADTYTVNTAIKSFAIRINAKIQS